MKRRTKFFLALIAVAIVFTGFKYYPSLGIATGFSAKNMASGVFVAKRSQGMIEAGDNGFFPVNLVNNKIDKNQGFVETDLFGLKKRIAVYKEGLGCILIDDDLDRLEKLNIPKRKKHGLNLPYPYGKLAQKDTLFAEVDYKQLKKAVDNAFDRGEEVRKGTRSVLVIYKDQIVAEKYAKGFDQHSLMLGWSMTKSITSTIYGVLSRQGKIDINKPTGIEAWQHDDRRMITYHNLLQMNSGLEWEEDYSSMSDATEMLYQSDDMGRVQINKELVGAPDQSWNYSSGTTNLLSGPLLREIFSSHQEYLDFWYGELLDKIGMESSIVETDLTGNYVGSSYGWATTRDWAKFGLLYMHRGNWNGEQILDSSWVDYVSTPTNSSNGRYGAQFWLNAGGHYPDVPKDMYSCNGYQGQYVIMIPSKGLTIVRFGLVEEPIFDMNVFMKDIIACFNN